jgi:hypothetical protein
MTWKRISAAFLTGVLSACSGDHEPALTVATESLSSPAGAGSGEPYLSASEDAVYLSWLEESPAGGHDLRMASSTGGAWSESRVIAHSERFFVNSADFPSVSVGEDGTLWAHWLERGGEGEYDYGVRVVRSADGGANWSEPWTPHDDRSPTEHGFVSTMPTAEGMGFVWLDGRKYAKGSDGSSPTDEMELWYRAIGVDGAPGPETRLDARVCDCCQTAAAISSFGPVVVYRDRSETEIRDIYVTRLKDGGWTEGVAVHEDGWEINGCPVNGPAVAAIGKRVAVAWFTGAGDVAHVKLAFSDDGGSRFGEPVLVDEGSPGGSVDLLMLDDRSALVSWLERGSDDVAQIRLRRVEADGSATQSATLSGSSASRPIGFPRMVAGPDGSVLLAWTDAQGDESRVQLTRINVVE